MDYMDRPTEVEKHPDARSFIRDAAGGDGDVLALLWSFWNFTHMLDDLLDESGWEDEKLCLAYKAIHDWHLQLLFNPFLLENSRSIFTMLVQMLDRDLAAKDMPKESEREKGLAEAVRCADIDFVNNIVYLKRGWEMMRALSERKY